MTYQQKVGGASNWEREKWLWNRFWRVPVWPRVKLFFWQLCSEALATKANIAARVRGECDFCSLCNSNIESSRHLFCDYVFAKRVWEGLGLAEEKDGDGGSIRDWVEAKWRGLLVREQVVFMVGCWVLWEHRNKVIFYSKTIDYREVVRRARDVVEEMDGGENIRVKGREEGQGSGGRPERAGWDAPRGGCVKDPLLAEAAAVLEGVKEAASRGHEKVIIESDCLTVIEALKKGSTGTSVFSLVLDDILFLRSEFTSISWSYTSRTNNSVAHALAHISLRVVGRFVWSDGLPPIANSSVAFDLISMQ
ncbi:uncharacterized protein LOC141641871 [Silene latifolia]|uniref:uncharacterized protein LOC141641871 n=1 Tax=Silene latifolia TaxID=37657 RepID=UPI003D77F01C